MTFVDNCLSIGLNISEINAVKRKIVKEYITKDRSPAAYFLGVQIIQNRTKRLLQLFQSHYIKKALKRFGLENSRPILIPLQPGLLGPNSSPINPVQNVENKLYQKIISTAMYPLTQTQPDIGFPIQQFSRFLQKPLQTYLNVGKNLLKFLGGTEELVICYGCEGLTNGLQSIGYCDSDFAGDKESFKSIYGYVFKFAGGPIN